MTQELKEEIDSSAEDYMRMLYTSRDLDTQQLQNFTWILSHSYGRAYFVELLKQPKFRTGQSHGLPSSTFTQLALIMYIAILEADRQADYSCAHKLLQLSQLFYR